MHCCSVNWRGGPFHIVFLRELARPTLILDKDDDYDFPVVSKSLLYEASRFWQDLFDHDHPIIHLVRLVGLDQSACCENWHSNKCFTPLPAKSFHCVAKGHEFTVANSWAQIIIFNLLVLNTQEWAWKKSFLSKSIETLNPPPPPALLTVEMQNKTIVTTHEDKL